MALVAYSDSEGSDDERAPVPAPTGPKRSKISFKILDRDAYHQFTKEYGTRKIKVDLPSVNAEPEKHDEQKPAAKRARTAGAFSGFNSLLPAPKQVAKSAPKAGVSLKTSSEAVFSRAPMIESGDWQGDDEESFGLNGETGEPPAATEAKEEPKIVGKATKFKPLSVSNKKKPIKKVVPIKESRDLVNGQSSAQRTEPNAEAPAAKTAPPPPPKPKKSLFSVPQKEDGNHAQSVSESYKPITTDADFEEPTITTSQPQHPEPIPTPSSTGTNSLQSAVSDLNLTPAQQRQLFGRHGQNQDVNITHFNLESEYAANEQLRQAGEVVEHRAVKAIAPGKHSLQQLVNNARSQQDGLEDKWAAGRQARGEGGSKYGFGR